MKLETKKTICLLIGIASILAIVSTISYAYFTATGEVKKLEATISTGTVSARFMDNDTGITGELQFGESITKKFTIENTGTVEARVKIYWKDLINTYTPETLTYTLSQSETLEGPYTEIVAKTNVPKSEEGKILTEVLVESLTIPVNKTYYYNLVITLNYLEDVNQDPDLSAKFSSTFSLTDEKGEVKKTYTSQDTLAYLKLTSNGTKDSYATAATTDEGIFEMEDDYGTSYYYRGAVTNNYVKFGQNKSGQDMYWRIIRINGDGSLRMIYDGTQGYVNGTANDNRLIMTSQPYNANSGDAKYVGWMYGPAGTIASTSKEEAQSYVVDSDVKKIVDEWYKENIFDTGYSTSVSDEIFCNDRSFADSNTGTGWGTSTTYYGAHGRLMESNPQPSFKCPEKNDAFTKDDTTKGNGMLEYPVGLITADEIVAAGSGEYHVSGGNSKYYLYKSNSYYQWSLSPAFSTIVFGIGTSGHLGRDYVIYASSAVAPVINLSAEYANTLIGEGTMESPYRTA